MSSKSPLFSDEGPVECVIQGKGKALSSALPIVSVDVYYGINTIPKVNTSVALPSEIGKEIVLYRLPSSSRAYPLSFDKKVEAYRNCFANLRIDN